LSEADKLINSQPDKLQNKENKLDNRGQKGSALQQQTSSALIPQKPSSRVAAW